MVEFNKGDVMNLSIAWVLIGGMITAAGVLTSSVVVTVGIIIALIASLAAKSGNWYLWKKK